MKTLGALGATVIVPGRIGVLAEPKAPTRWGERGREQGRGCCLASDGIPNLVLQRMIPTQGADGGGNFPANISQPKDIKRVSGINTPLWPHFCGWSCAGSLRNGNEKETLRRIKVRRLKTQKRGSAKATRSKHKGLGLAPEMFADTHMRCSLIECSCACVKMMSYHDRIHAIG